MHTTQCFNRMRFNKSWKSMAPLVNTSRLNITKSALTNHYVFHVSQSIGCFWGLMCVFLCWVSNGMLSEWSLYKVSSSICWQTQRQKTPSTWVAPSEMEAQLLHQQTHHDWIAMGFRLMWFAWLLLIKPITPHLILMCTETLWYRRRHAFDSHMRECRCHGCPKCDTLLCDESIHLRRLNAP